MFQKEPNRDKESTLDNVISEGMIYRLFPFCLAYFFAIQITESSIVNVSFVVITRVYLFSNIRINSL